ncbi:hypothetical protein [Hoeflea sp.]|uniref:hypothetical protein n=1 Tax=Hoeflea sp. TaxID=1940281 RepID=UPI003A8CD453
MSDHDRASRSRIAWLGGPGKLWRLVWRLALRLARRQFSWLCGRRLHVQAGVLDARMRQDIGIHGTGLDDAAWPDPRDDHYRRLLGSGYRLG